MAAKDSKGQVCYLCGESIEDSPEDIGLKLARDHVPPRLFYPKAIRKKENLNLEVAQSHQKCNEYYRKDEELIKSAQSRKIGCLEEAISSTITILEKLYGTNSEKLKAYIHLYQDYVRNPHKNAAIVYESIHSGTLGILKSIKSEVAAGLVGNLELQAQGGIFADFITLARESLDENKDVAAVLVSAALEDALKRFALQSNLDVAEKDMSEVINALKSKGLLKDPQASIVQGHTKLRNKAFHANWDNIETASVNSAIAFTESFILDKFSSN
ncbi:unnamed protein product [marine sediment metagenome]|uniref:DUF4145 domain-containing protein n=1 Tax=marine sediment metagenome TaxID=412755 RepID=X1S8D8_9ZZZZ